WQRFSQALIVPGGWHEIDDIALDKFGERIFGVTWVYSSCQQRVVRGHDVMAMIWTDGQRRISGQLQALAQGGPAKVVLAAGLRPDYVVIDSWHSTKRLLKQSRSYDWRFVTRSTPSVNKSKGSSSSCAARCAGVNLESFSSTA